MRACLFEHLQARCELAKVPLCLLIGCAALFGFMMGSPTIPAGSAFFVPLGVFLVATGAASLNSLQEHQVDGRMERTRKRPLPTGRLTRGQAGRQAVFLLLTGLFSVSAGADDFLPMAVTAGAVVLYNGIYTPLKQKSVLAIVPGALCGALPATIGWLAGGGGMDFRAILLVTLFILWQVPHFWLVLLAYRHDYADGRLPNLLNQLSEKSLKRLLITWIGCLSIVMLLFAALPYSPFSSIGLAVRFAVAANGLLLPAFFVYGVALRNSPNYRFFFVVLNSALLFHMILLTAGRLAGG